MRSFFITCLMLLNASLIFSNNLALPCYGCHGPSGKPSGESIPSIEGLPKEYLKKSMNEYKNGVRNNYIMGIISKGYSNKEIDALASFFSSIKKND